MSAKIECKAEIRNINLLTEAMRELKLDHDVNDNVVVIERNYNSIIFDLNKKTGSNVSYDSADEILVHKIMRTYQKVLAFDTAIKEGHTIKSCEETASGEIIIRALING